MICRTRSGFSAAFKLLPPAIVCMPDAANWKGHALYYTPSMLHSMLSVELHWLQGFAHVWALRHCDNDIHFCFHLIQIEDSHNFGCNSLACMWSRKSDTAQQRTAQLWMSQLCVVACYSQICSHSSITPNFEC